MYTAIDVGELDFQDEKNKILEALQGFSKGKVSFDTEDAQSLNRSF